MLVIQPSHLVRLATLEQLGRLLVHHYLDRMLPVVGIIPKMLRKVEHRLLHLGTAAQTQAQHFHLEVKVLVARFHLEQRIVGTRVNLASLSI